jgi:nondiscriminating glutamyl-tRNA synthetase
LACVVDDHEMGVTHVLRAEDHLSNTPKQIWLYQALGWEPPAFGHLSMILGPDRHKLSKRHGATSVETLREQGFLPEAVANGLALLGWSPPTGEEVLTPPELVARFSLDRVVISPQVFDMDKLTWLNRKHLARLSGEEFFRRAVPYLDWLGHEVPEGKLIAALELVQPSLATLADLREHPDLVILFRRPALPAAARSLSFPKAQTALQEVLRRLPAPLRREDLRPIVQAIATELSLPTRDVFHPLRLALTGREEGPELAAICTILGTEEVRARIEAVLALGQ